MSKGFQLSATAMIVIVAALLVIVIFLSTIMVSSGSQISKADAQRIYSSTCNIICKYTIYENYKTALRLQENNQEFLKACQMLGYGDIKYPNRCMESCGCEMKVTTNDTSAELNNIIGAFNQMKTVP
jgi:hypothetical protein